MISVYERISTALCLLAAVLLLSTTGCDVPTESPDFSFDSSVRTPVLLSETFTLLGAGGDGTEALIDTTLVDYDSLFAVDADGALSLSQSINSFELGGFDDALPALDLPATNLSVSLSSLATQSLSASFQQQPFGTFFDTLTVQQLANTLPEGGTPNAPIRVEGDSAYANENFPNQIAPSEIDVPTIGTVGVVRFTHSAETEGLNAVTFSLENRFPAQRLVRRSGSGVAAPELVLVDARGGAELARGSFGAPVEPQGGVQNATVSVAGETLPPQVRYYIDVTTENAGFAPIAANPEAVGLGIVSATPFQYQALTLDLDEVDALTFDQEAVTLIDDDDVAGVIASDLALDVTVDNDFPYPIAIDQIDLVLRSAVGSNAAGTATPLRPQSAAQIPAGGRATVTFVAQDIPISNSVDLRVQASLPGTAPARIQPANTLGLEASGEVSVDQVFADSDGLAFSENGQVELDVEEVTFADGDYAVIESGTLDIEDLTNGLPFALRELTISLPGLRTSPAPADSVVICFGSSSACGSATYQFARIEAGTDGRDEDVDLSGLRLYPTDDALAYSVSATTAATDGAAPVNVSDDGVSVSVGASNLEVRALEATLRPFSVAVTDDDDGDGRLDVFSDAEAEITDLNLSDISDLQPRGFQLQDASMTLEVTTNLEADVVLYAALVGTSSGGGPVYLSGRGAYAVQADSIAEDFAGLDADQLIKLPLNGNTTIVLNDENSTISAFISTFPEEVRFAGKALLGTGGSRVSVEQPITLDASLNLDVPLALQGMAQLSPNVDADLSSLPDLTGENQTLRVQQADLEVSYDNALPVGFGLRIDVLDASGETLVTLPAEGTEPLRIQRAPLSEAGTSDGSQEGQFVISITESQLERMSEAGEEIELLLSVTAPENETARLRSSDRLSITMEGNFSLRVQAGGN